MGRYTGHRVRLVIPTDRQADIAPIIGRIVGRWSGCTVTTGNGWWNDNDGVPVKDTLSILECSIGVWDSAASEWWYNLSDVVRKEWEQDAVLLSVVPETAELIIGPVTAYSRGNITPVIR